MEYDGFFVVSVNALLKQNWLPAWWASGFSGDQQQNHQCWFPSCYNVTHVFSPSLFAFFWKSNYYLLLTNSRCDGDMSHFTAMWRHGNRAYPMRYVCTFLSVWQYYQFSVACTIYTIFSKVASMTLGQSYDCPSAVETNLTHMGKLIRT